MGLQIARKDEVETLLSLILLDHNSQFAQAVPCAAQGPRPARTICRPRSRVPCTPSGNLSQVAIMGGLLCAKLAAISTNLTMDIAANSGDSRQLAAISSN